MAKPDIGRLKAITAVGHTVSFKDKKTGALIRWGIVEDEVHVMVGDYKRVLQRIRCLGDADFGSMKGTYWDGSKIGYRTGYYTYDKARKRIIWGQFTQFLTQKEYHSLLNQAKGKGWIS